jgi:formylglycine-generating enzyme required for sulfatase activity
MSRKNRAKRRPIGKAPAAAVRQPAFRVIPAVCLAGLAAVVAWSAVRTSAGLPILPRTRAALVAAPAPIAPAGSGLTASAGLKPVPDCCPVGEGETVTASATQPASAPPDTATRLNAAAPPREAPEGMVWVPGGAFLCGNDTPAHRDARPWHRVEVGGFWMDVTPVTNERFQKFVEATGYVTVAERTPRAEDYPTAAPQDLVAGSVVFSPPTGAVPLDDHFRWWGYRKGASWRRPDGPESDLAGRGRHPVVHVCYDDALAYCKWAGKRLPTEAEFEFAARGGLERKHYAWGDDLRPGGKWVMRGGSYLCTDQYCTAYEAGARGKGAPDTGTNHLGFRCVKSPE